MIAENDEFYVSNIGVREFIVADDLSYATPGGVSIAFKKSGELASRPSSMMTTDPAIQSRPNLTPTMT